MVIALILLPARVTVNGMALSAQPKQARHLPAYCVAPAMLSTRRWKKAASSSQI
jgi:hypothetical protein